MILPPRSVSALVLCANVLPNGEAATPPAQSTVLASNRLSPSAVWNLKPSLSISFTNRPVRTCTPSFSRERCAFADKSGGKAESRRGPPSIRMIFRASLGLIERKSFLSVCRAISAMAPANSTPVAPPPTITKVSQAWRCGGSVTRSATSNAVRILLRMLVASSIVLRLGAHSRHSSWP